MNRPLPSLDTAARPLSPAEREALDMRCPVARQRYVLTERELLDPGVNRRPREPRA